MFEVFEFDRNFSEFHAFKDVGRNERDSGTKTRIISMNLCFTLGKRLMYNEESGIIYPAHFLPVWHYNY